MSDPSNADIAATLDKVADTLESRPSLDPDGAVRLVVWGNSEALYPGDDEPGACLFDEVESLIECYIAHEDRSDPGNGIAWIEPRRAVRACRAEAARYRTYS